MREVTNLNIKKIIRSERGDVSYISTFVYILVAMIMVAFILNVFHIISVKQIQLNGGTNADTGALFSYLAAPLSEVEGLTYQVTSCGSTNRIQIGTPFYVTVTGRCYLGGFWKLNLVPIDIKANGAGVSEHYWK